MTLLANSALDTTTVHGNAHVNCLCTGFEAKVPQRCCSRIAPPAQLSKADYVYLHWSILCRPQHGSPPAVACTNKARWPGAPAAEAAAWLWSQATSCMRPMYESTASPRQLQVYVASVNCRLTPASAASAMLSCAPGSQQASSGLLFVWSILQQSCCGM